MANAVQQFQSQMNSAIVTMNTLLDQMPRLERMYAANGIGTTMAATTAGDIVAGGNLTIERMTEQVTVLVNLIAWFDTPVSEGGPTPKTLISKVD